MLVRRVFPLSTELHRGVWNKSERGMSRSPRLTLRAIVGYGRIGSQLGEILAEALGMRVISATWFTCWRRNAKRVTFKELLESADVRSRSMWTANRR